MRGVGDRKGKFGRCSWVRSGRDADVVADNGGVGFEGVAEFGRSVPWG